MRDTICQYVIATIETLGITPLFDELSIIKRISWDSIGTTLIRILSFLSLMEILNGIPQTNLTSYLGMFENHP